MWLRQAARFGNSRVGSKVSWSSGSQFERDGLKQPAALKSCNFERLVRIEKREPSPVNLAAGVVKEG